MDPYSGAQCDRSIQPQSAAFGQGAGMSESEDGRMPSHRVWRQPIGWGEGRDDEMQARASGGRGGKRYSWLFQTDSSVPPMMCGGRRGWGVTGRWPRGPVQKPGRLGGRGIVSKAC